jgi:hypothetical protein
VTLALAGHPGTLAYSRASLLRGRCGEARAVVAAAEGDTYMVENTNDSGAGSFRAGVEAGGLWVRISPKLIGWPYAPASAVHIAPGTTIDARGSGMSIGNGGYGLVLDMADAADGTTAAEVIVAGLTIDGVLGSGSADGFQILGDHSARQIPADLIWLDHMTFSDCADGLLDITRPVGNGLNGVLARITVSRSEFGPHPGAAMIAEDPDFDWDDLDDIPAGGKTNLIGDSSNNTGWTYERSSTMRVTRYMNWTHGTLQRNPRVINARCHTVFDVIDNFGWPAENGAPKGRCFETFAKGQLRIYEPYVGQYAVNDPHEADGTLVTDPAIMGMIHSSLGVSGVGPMVQEGGIWAAGVSHLDTVHSSASYPASPIFVPDYELDAATALETEVMTEALRRRIRVLAGAH